MSELKLKTSPGNIIGRECLWLLLCAAVAMTLLLGGMRVSHLSESWGDWWHRLLITKRVPYMLALGSVGLYAVARTSFWLFRKGRWFSLLWLAPIVLTIAVLTGFYVQSRLALHTAAKDQGIAMVGFPFEMYIADYTSDGQQRGWWEWPMVPANAAIYLAVFTAVIYPLILHRMYRKY